MQIFTAGNASLRYVLPLPTNFCLHWSTKRLLSGRGNEHAPPWLFSLSTLCLGKRTKGNGTHQGGKKRKKTPLLAPLEAIWNTKGAHRPITQLSSPRKKRMSTPTPTPAPNQQNKQISKQQQTKQGITTLLEQITGFSIFFASGEKETRKVMVPIGRLDCGNWSNGAVRK